MFGWVDELVYQSCAMTSATGKRSSGSKRSMPLISDSSSGSTSDGTVNSPFPIDSNSLQDGGAENLL